MAGKKVNRSSSKRLARSKDKTWLGVCGGVAEYFGIDPVLVRIAFILITVFSGFVPGFVAYVLAAWVMPER